MPAQTAEGPQASPRTIAVASLVALTVAALVLVVAVLPAEYGLDPLGTGRALGLLELADATPGAIVPQPDDYKLDAIEFVLGPFESLEYKYRLEEGGSLLYVWQATGELVYDFHAEPDDAPDGYAQSFDQQRARERRGTYTAPFPGIHGWFWENRGTDDVTLTLTTAGFYTAAHEFRDGLDIAHSLTDISPIN
jgi:hypothetical protein